MRKGTDEKKIWEKVLENNEKELCFMKQPELSQGLEWRHMKRKQSFLIKIKKSVNPHAA